MKNNIRNTICLALISLIAIAFSSCNADANKGKNKVISVTLPPLYGIIEAIVGDDYTINIVLPQGSSPENFSPTIGQMAALEESDMIFSFGLMPFELAIEERLVERYGNAKVVNISKGVQLPESQCAHSSHYHNHKHHHGTDPHIWISPELLKEIAKQVGAEICSKGLDSARYTANTQQLVKQIEQRQVEYKQLLKCAEGKPILIYHPTLGYLANEYGFKQIALEKDGKSPTPADLAEIINIVENKKIKYFFYQAEFPREVIQSIVDMLKIKALEINSLNKYPIVELDRIVNIINNEYE